MHITRLAIIAIFIKFSLEYSTYRIKCDQACKNQPSGHIKLCTYGYIPTFVAIVFIVSLSL